MIKLIFLKISEVKEMKVSPPGPPATDLLWTKEKGNIIFYYKTSFYLAVTLSKFQVCDKNKSCKIPHSWIVID